MPPVEHIVIEEVPPEKEDNFWKYFFYCIGACFAGLTVLLLIHRLTETDEEKRLF